MLRDGQAAAANNAAERLVACNPGCDSASSRHTRAERASSYASEQPAILALHHPPIDIGAEIQERVGLYDRDGLAAWLDRRFRLEELYWGRDYDGAIQAWRAVLAKAAEKRLRETCSEVLGSMGDTLKARLLGLSSDFSAEEDDEFPPKKK